VQYDAEQHKNLDATLREIMRLLERHALVHQLATRADTRKPELAQSLLARQQAVELEKKLNRLHPADAAFVLESLQHEQRITAWLLINPERRGSILFELAEPVRAALVTQLGDAELGALGRQMEAEDFAELVQELPQERVDHVLAQLDSRDSADVRSVLAFPEDSVGALMQLDAVTVRDDLTLEQAIASLRKRRNLPESFTLLAVVDQNNVLSGTLPLDRLVVGNGAVAVADVMDKDPVRFLTTDPVDDAAQAFERYDLIAAPVVNLHGHVVGSLTVDDVLEHVTQDSFRQSLSQVGLDENEDLFAPIWRSSRKRWAWLGLNLLTAFRRGRALPARARPARPRSRHGLEHLAHGDDR
jgi:magnesium transporter